MSYPSVICVGFTMNEGIELITGGHSEIEGSGLTQQDLTHVSGALAFSSDDTHASGDFPDEEESGGEPSREDVAHPFDDIGTGEFGQDWVAYMETLEILNDDELYQDISTTGSLPDEWEQHENKLYGCLGDVGLTDKLLAYQRGAERQILEQALLQLGLLVSMKEFAWLERRLIRKVEELAAGLRMAKRLRGESGGPVVQMLHDAMPIQRPQPKVTTPSAYLEEMLAGEFMKRPLRGRRNKLVTQDDQHTTREQRDTQEKKFWTQEVIAWLRKSCAPVVDLAAGSHASQSIMEVAVGATRGSTMRSYLRVLIPYFLYLERTQETFWTDNVIDALEFLKVVSERPCSPSYPQKLSQALRWYQRTGGWAGGSILTDSPLWAKAVGYWTEALYNQVQPLKQAPRLPWIMVAAMELFIVDESNPLALRYKAFITMLKLIGTLREDDIQHFNVRKLRIMGEVLSTVIMRTKTTGAAKRVRQLPVAIWSGWTLTGTLWLEHGLGMAADVLESCADYSLPLFDQRGQPSKEPMPYSGSAALSKKLYTQLRVPTYNLEDRSWKQSSERLLLPRMASFWTEHSPRAVMPSSAQLLGFSKEIRDCLGRWSPTGADDYARGYRLAVGKVQRRVLEAVLAGDGRLAEHEVLDRISQAVEIGTFNEDQARRFKDFLESRVEGFAKELAKAREVEPDPVSGIGGSSDLLEDIEVPAEVPGKPEKAGMKKLKFLVVYSRNRRSAKLHRIGGCEWSRLTLNDSQEFESVNSKMYNARCKLCWPPGKVETRDASSSDDSSESDV